MSHSSAKAGDIVQYLPQFSIQAKIGLIIRIKNFIDESAYICLNEHGQLETYWVKCVSQLKLVSAA